MRIAVLADIHGNLIALEAVLADLARQGAVDATVCLGDLAFKGPHPGECVARIRDLGIPCIHGNTDLYLLAAAGRATASPVPAQEFTGAIAPYLAWHLEHMASADLDYLSALPFEHRITAEHGRLLFVHATPQDCFAAIQRTDAPETLDLRLRDIDLDRLVFGHTHCQLAYRHRGVQLVNPGAIGHSLDRDWRAAYAILGTATGEVRLLRVEYDIAQAVAAAEARSFCFSPQWYGAALRQGWWDPIPWEQRRAVDGFPRG